MAFRVSARTVLELGAELISSDAIAIYELIKNAIDAGSDDGIEIHFSITLGYSNYVESLAELGYWVGLPGPERRIFGGLDG